MFLNMVKSILIVSLLTACGGGGSSDDNNDDGHSNLTDNGGDTGVDKIAPIITILGKTPISIIQDSSYTDAGATAKDNVDGRVSVKSVGSVNSSKIGQYTITYTATDKAGNKATAKRIVNVIKKGTVADIIAPIITILGKNPVIVVQNSTYKDAGATAKDNIDGEITVKSSGSVNTSVVKSYTITYTATDKAGNKSTSKRIVKVIKKVLVNDITAPTITIIGDNPASVVQNTTYKDAGATAKDNIDGTIKVKSKGSVDTSTLGEYTITYTATDKSGNKATKTRKVNVTLPLDKIAPVIIISGDNPLKIYQGETFSDPGATATDDRDGVITVTPTGKVDMSTAGDYTITYTATDKAGNKTKATRTVTVKPADVVWNVSNITEFRQALEDAAANGESDIIILAKGVYNVDSDGLGTLTFDDNEEFNLTIEALNGLTNKEVVLDGNNSKQVFNFNNKQSSILILKNISVIDGNSTENGAVYTNQNIKIVNCKISNNISSAGGGFYSTGTTFVINSNVSNNISTYTGGGFFSGGVTTITNSIISNNDNTHNHYYNSSGAGFHSNGTTIISNSTISNNTSSTNGGGFSTNLVTINNSTIIKNSANNGGGFYASSVTINNSTIINNSAKNYGGGFYGSSATVINSIFTENNASQGAIFHTSTYYEDSYFSNNTFVENGGSIYSKGIFVNNIFSENDKDITLNGDSKVYNNYIDYNKIEDGSYNLIKKKNLQPDSVGDIYLTSKYALKSKSPVLNKGLNPSSSTYKKLIGGEEKSYNYSTGAYDIIYPQYNKMLELLKTDKVGNKRVHNSTIDMGAVEYGSSK